MSLEEVAEVHCRWLDHFIGDGGNPAFSPVDDADIKFAAIVAMCWRDRPMSLEHVFAEASQLDDDLHYDILKEVVEEVVVLGIAYGLQQSHELDEGN